ncbi:MAG TPA: thiamine phosphate synthase [Candidatus Binatus sp.]|nr:thiamine phosphate synthase [Candidatus Binatus sp.]
MTQALRTALRDRRLYLITDTSPKLGLLGVIEAAVQGGVDMVQLREKRLDDGELLAAAREAARLCRRLGVPFIVNDRADIARAAGADGVHLGQDDLPVEEARALMGPDAFIGLSTHSSEQVDAALDVDYIGVGPIHETPTKPGRPAVGTPLVRYAAAHAVQPFFAIGGLEPGNVGDVVRAGARNFSVLRYVANADDPRRAAREMIDAIDSALATQRASRGSSV